MTTMPEGCELDPQAKNRITRYLHTGNELPRYYPGCWSSHKYFELDRLPTLQQIFAEGPNNVDVVDIILTAGRDGTCTRFETIAFALAKCLMHGSSNVKQAAYKAASMICKTPEQYLLFHKYTRMFKTGNGRGWCKNIKEWYSSKDPMELAKELTRVRARHGRSHKTLLRKSHIKLSEEDYARDAVFKYTIFGLKRAKQLLADKPGTKEIFEYIHKVEDMRHCEDPDAAATIASENNFTLDHVPGHLLTSQNVWNAVLPQMSLSELLYYIQRIHNMGFLTNDSTTTAIIVSLLTSPEIIKKSKVTPMEVYIALSNYINKAKPMKFDKAKIAVEKEQRRRTRQTLDPKTGLWQWNTDKRHPKEAKNWGIDLPTNQAIIGALNKLVDLSWQLTPPTKARYLITLDMRHHMFKGRHFCKTFVIPKKGKKVKTSPAPAAAAAAAAAAAGDADSEKKSNKRLVAECFYSKHVTPGRAAVITALHLLKREKNAKLAVFTEEGINIVSIERNFSSIEEAEFLLRKESLGRVQLDAPMTYAMKTKQKFDVFINIIDRVSRYMELDIAARGGRGPGGRFGPPPTKEIPDHCPVRALERYRNTVGLPNAKLIVMSLASHRVGVTDGSHEGVLDIAGIDEHVPNVMDAFVRGHFK